VFCQPIDRDGVARLLPDEDSVLLCFYFMGEDLLVVPFRRDQQGSAGLRHAETGYFRVVGVRAQLEGLWERHRRGVDRWRRHLSPAPEEGGPEGDLTSLCVELHKTLQLDRLFAFVEPDDRWRARLHLVLVPDGPLYLLPLHAACVHPGAPRAYEQVASLRYALSLRTLELQQEVQERRLREAPAEEEEPRLRGVAFANPDRAPADRAAFNTATFLKGVIREGQILLDEGGDENWWLHGDSGPPDTLATRANFRDHHTAGNVGWLMGHGGSGAAFADDLKDVANQTAAVMEPALRLVDGAVSMSRLLAEGFDFSKWRLLHVSACLLGQLNPLGTSRELLGYLAVLTVLGCRRVVSATWELSDESAPDFTRCWLRALNRHVFNPDAAPSPHAFAVAFREATDCFRRTFPHFDHEFHWAPYALYGLG
jgi:hypothetical protein